MRKKKKKNNKYLKRSLCIVLGFFFVLLTYFDFKVDKTKNDLVTYNDEIFTNVNSAELLNILDNKKGIVLIVNDRKDINRLIGLVMKININERIYVYNAKDEELVLELSNNEVVVKQSMSKNYEKLLQKLGSFTERYLIQTPSGNLVETGYFKINTPTTLFVSDGRVIFSSYIKDDSVSDDDLVNVYKKGLNLLETGNFS